MSSKHLRAINKRIWYYRSMVQLILLSWLIAMGSVIAVVPHSLANQVVSRNTKPNRFYPEAVSTTLEDFERVVQVIAIFTGGLWVYFKFLKGRTFQPKLELSVSGSISRYENLDYMIVAIVLKPTFRTLKCHIENFI